MSDRRQRAKTRNVDTTRTNEQYIDLKINGRLFPSWVLKNFKQYKLPEILRKEGDDRCNVEIKLELRKYQEFMGKYLGPTSPYNGILLYHGLGSGKTATSINLMNIMYNYTPNVVFIILIKRSLREDPWMKDLKMWLGRDVSEANVQNINQLGRYKAIHFVHYDSPFAGQNFLDVMKSVDTSKRLVFIIDEVHNFIRNVYSNITTKTGKRAQIIYEYILQQRRENKDVKIVLISATPIVNFPFELSLLFNLLRPGIFPQTETEFNRIFITESAYPVLNPTKKNLFSRRILGLISYYVGATPDLFAEKRSHEVVLPMSNYQYEIYRIFEKIEAEIQRKATRVGKSSQLYRSYTRQACNFVFPRVTERLNGQLRPRPGQYKLSQKLEEDLLKGKKREDLAEHEKILLDDYGKALEYFVVETEKYFRTIKESDEKSGKTLQKDIETYKQSNYDFLTFHKADLAESKLYHAMYNSSPKMLAIVFNIALSKGKVMIYSNYVIMEGIDMMKVYLRLGNYALWSNAEPYKGYCEYHGRIPQEDRIKTKNMFNTSENKYGEKCLIILLSPSATEGIQLYNMRQEHILEPYWNEVRIQQVIGRGHRQCSHKELPKEERVLDVYRYLVTKPAQLAEDDTVKVSTDEYIQDRASSRENLNESFLAPMREAAVDCELFKAHNMISQSYNCFQFPETSTAQNIGAAYREDLKDDIKYDSGLGARNSHIERIKVIKIFAVTQLTFDVESTFSAPIKYWYYPKDGMVYDFDTHYPVGRVLLTNGIPNKLDKDTYIITNVVEIPTIEG